MPRYKDLMGQKFGMLKVLDYCGLDKHSKAKWLCVCDCGNTTTSVGNNLIRGKSNSCGCTRMKNLIKSVTTHGMSRHPIYKVYRSMLERCNDVGNKGYNCYGGRGIKVCDRWMNSFENFRDDMFASYSTGLTLDRIQTNGNYCKENCRWVTQQQNCLNTRAKGGSSSFKGVSFHKLTGKWSSGIGYNGKHYYLGLYEKEEDATIAYNQKAVDLHGEWAHLNEV